MSDSGFTPEDFAIDTLALNYITQAISEATGDRAKAEALALDVSLSPRVWYAALCVIAESEPWETLSAAVQDTLTGREG